MKYINTHYSLFDTSTFSNYFAGSNYGGGFSGGEGKITLNAQTTKLYVSFEMRANHNGSFADPNCWPLQIFFSDSEYNKFDALSCVQLNVMPYDGKLYLKTKNTERIQTAWVNGTWHKIYLAVDTVAGTIDFWMDGLKVGTYTNYVKTGVKAISAKVKLIYKSDDLCTRVKNIIISDQYFPINETIIEVPATVTANGFSYDSNKNEYSTEAEDSTLQAKPDLSVINGYKVTACNVCPVTQTQGDTIKNLQCDMGDYSKTNEIKQGMYFDDLPTSINNITVTAKK